MKKNISAMSEEPQKKNTIDWSFSRWNDSLILTSLTVFFFWVVYVYQDSMNILLVPYIALGAFVIFSIALSIGGPSRKKMLIIGGIIIIAGLTRGLFTWSAIAKENAGERIDQQSLQTERETIQSIVTSSECNQFHFQETWKQCVKKTVVTLQDANICRGQVREKITSPTVQQSKYYAREKVGSSEFADCSIALAIGTLDAGVCLVLAQDQEIIMTDLWDTYYVEECLARLAVSYDDQVASQMCMSLPVDKQRTCLTLLVHWLGPVERQRGCELLKNHFQTSVSDCQDNG